MPTKNTTCNANINDNAGCGVVDWSRVSYGPQFDALGGGMYAMKWDETGVAVCMFPPFYCPQPFQFEQGTSTEMQYQPIY